MEPTVRAPATAGQEFSSSDFRRALGVFATGVTVITTRGADEDDLFAMTANAFSSVSLDPPLVLVCVMQGSSGNEAIARNGLFAVNILAAEQEAISNSLPGVTVRADARLSRRSLTASPRRELRSCNGTVAHLDCRLEGDHEPGTT